ncbi:hypothetical protein [Streptomyces sp. NPDC058964]|uniref:hypothetical protein n=1 Tax=Streptomyces sp. NPDC058964 TaxID=3346681 RepID=UPI0036994BB5
MRPDLAPRVPRDEVLEAGGERRLAGLRPVDVRVAEHLPALRHPPPGAAAELRPQCGQHGLRAPRAPGGRPRGSPRARHRFLLRLTDDGLRTHRKPTVRTARMNQVFPAPLSAEEQTLFFELIRRVSDAAEGLRNPAEPLAAHP